MRKKPAFVRPRFFQKERRLPLRQRGFRSFFHETSVQKVSLVSTAVKQTYSTLPPSREFHFFEESREWRHACARRRSRREKKKEKVQREKESERKKKTARRERDVQRDDPPVPAPTNTRGVLRFKGSLKLEGETTHRTAEAPREGSSEAVSLKSSKNSLSEFPSQRDAGRTSAKKFEQRPRCLPSGMSFSLPKHFNPEETHEDAPDNDRFQALGVLVTFQTSSEKQTLTAAF